MKKREADFGVLFRHWIRANPPRLTCAFELKQTMTDSLLFSSFEDHQVVYAEAVAGSPKGVLMRVQGTNGEPDYLYLYQDPVFVVIKYPHCFCIIPVASFIRERNTSKRKSLTSERAQFIAQQIVPL